MAARDSTVCIVGGGVGGLSAAIRLAARGFRVRLLEKNARVGGKLNLWQVPHPRRPDEPPFRFDTGPSLLTLPFVFEDLFAAAGASLRERLDLIRLDPVARFVWSDGATFCLRSGEEAMEQELRRFAPHDLEGFRRFVQRGRRIWDLSAELFLFHAPEQVVAGRVGGNGRGPLGLLTTPFRIGMFRRYSDDVDRDVRSPRLREVLYQYATYSGASPFRAPATLAVIPHAELHFGGWYIRGGMYRLAEALESLARSLGVEIRTGAPVASVEVERVGRRRRVRGVRLADGSGVEADVVVVNADVVYAYRHLLDPADRPHYPNRRLDRLEPGGSGMILLLGVEGPLPSLAHHTKFMPEDYRADLDAMFETRTVPTDPCIYVCASTRSDPSQAPPGCENLFVLCSAPALDGSLDWRAAGERYEQQVVQTLERRFGLEGLSGRVVVRKRFTPQELHDTYNANAGSIYGIGSNSRRSAFLRPPNRDKRIAGLFFAGGATHPGGGLPLVALSGKIVSELIAD